MLIRYSRLEKAHKNDPAPAGDARASFFGPMRASELAGRAFTGSETGSTWRRFSTPEKRGQARDFTE
jgi:hypothetical protein